MLSANWIGGIRWSYTATGWCGLASVDGAGKIVVRHELLFRGVSPDEAAERLTEKLRDEAITLQYLAGNPEMFPKGDESSPAVADAFSRAKIPMRRGTTDRLNGWWALRAWLQPRPLPWMVFHRDCKYLLRTLPTLTADDLKPDDMKVIPESYPAEGLLHMVMARPQPWKQPEEIKPMNPLSGAYLWNELRQGAENSGRYVGWNRRRV